MMDDLLIRQIFRHIIGTIGLTSHQGVLRKVTRRLFDDLDTAVLQKNQKFDFSFRFSRDAPAGLRFTYNDFDEKAACRKKFLDIFSMLASRPTCSLAKQILNLAPLPAPFQTTLGLEWLANEEHPRLKIYMEELPNNTSAKDRQRYLRKIARILGWKDVLAARLEETDPAAIAVDFLAREEQHLKLYTKHETRDEAMRSLNNTRDIKTRKLYDRFFRTSCDETLAFYAVSQRWHGHALRPAGLKLYKVYSVRQIEDSRRARQEITNTLMAFRFIKTPQARLINHVRALCARRSTDLCPVLFAFDPGTPLQIDVYYALQNKAG